MTCALVCLMTSCDDMNSVHQEYLDRGANVYLGIPVIIEANPGLKRVELVWSLNADPRIVETRIFWNNRQDSVVVPVDRTTPISAHILPLPEGAYNFEMMTANRAGNRSLPALISVQSFGEVFQNSLRNRSVTVSGTLAEAILNFSIELDVVETKISYTNNAGQPKVVTVPGNQSMVTIDDFVLGSDFTHSSLYLPPNALDLIPSIPTTGRFSMRVDLDRTAWTITTDQGNGFPNVNDGTTGLPMHVLNNNAAQFLSLFKPGGTIAGQTAPPIDFSPSFTVDLQESNPFNYFRWQHRQGNNGQQLRAFAVNLYGSNDGATFTQIMPATPAAPLFPSLFWIPVTNGYTGADAADSQYYYIDVPESVYRYVKAEIVVWSNKYRVDPPTVAYPTIYQHPLFPGNGANGWGNAVQICQFGLGWFYN